MTLPKVGSDPATWTKEQFQELLQDAAKYDPKQYAKIIRLVRSKNFDDLLDSSAGRQTLERTGNDD